MKKKTMLLLTGLLLLPTATYMQVVPAILPKRMMTFDKIITKFKQTRDYYTECFKTRSTCSLEEKQRRWQEVQSTAWSAIKAATALVLLITALKFTRPQQKALFKHLTYTIQRKRSGDLKIGDVTKPE